MIAMNLILGTDGGSYEIDVEYLPEIDESADVACVRVVMDDTTVGSVALYLHMHEVRALAEQFTRMVMAHDAAEHVRIEQAAAEKSAASPQAA
ncbi:hypothetical protein [Nocardia salmonicida]|uniref:hypothetical protein n=2 Tax=Nocardia salmonicida TaxID=53431 RepID=UPI002E2B0FFD|nr:hypothetical protein [Nocardia salmonicida]